MQFELALPGGSCGCFGRHGRSNDRRSGKTHIIASWLAMWIATGPRKTGNLGSPCGASSGCQTAGPSDSASSIHRACPVLLNSGRPADNCTVTSLPLSLGDHVCTCPASPPFAAVSGLAYPGTIVDRSVNLQFELLSQPGHGLSLGTDAFPQLLAVVARVEDPARGGVDLGH